MKSQRTGTVKNLQKLADKNLNKGSPKKINERYQSNLCGTQNLNARKYGKSTTWLQWLFVSTVH